MFKKKLSAFILAGMLSIGLLGTVDMGSSSVNTWKTLFSQKSVMSGPGYYSIKLNPKGTLKSGCYGAGKLVD